MSFPEACIVAIFIVWALVSAFYAIGNGRLHKALTRINWFEGWVRWSLFNSSDPAVRPAVFEIEYRDRDRSGTATPWRVGMTDLSWRWHAFLWNPEQRLADGVHHLGRAIKACVETGGGGTSALRAHVATIESHLRRYAPPPPGTERDYRIMRRFHAMSGLDRELVFAFSTAKHAAAR